MWPEAAPNSLHILEEVSVCPRSPQQAFVRLWAVAALGSLGALTRAQLPGEAEGLHCPPHVPVGTPAPYSVLFIRSPPVK